MPEQQDHGADGALRLPQKTTPTWEIELLISGATVFGLLQLPSRLEGLLIQVLNRVDSDLSALLVPLWIYLQTALAILIATFILHLCARAYWVALVGLLSVYPDGVRWEAFKRAGPHQLAASRRGREDMPALVEAADNRASRVFGVGVGLATTMVIPVALVVVCLLLTLATRTAVWPLTLEPLWLFSGLALLMFLPWGIALLLDRLFGARWSRETGAGRLLLAILGFYSRIGFGRASNLPLALYSSNSKGQSGNVVLGIASMLVLFLVAAQVISLATRWDVSDNLGLPSFSEPGHDVLQPSHYASQRAREPALIPRPFIPDPVVKGPYLRLFVPYRASRHNQWIDEECREPGDGERAARVALDCLAKMHDVRINGAAVAGLRFDAAEDPVSHVRGMLAMIPVAGLANGRHELSVLPPPRKEAQSKADDAPDEPYIIPFWR